MKHFKGKHPVKKILFWVTMGVMAAILFSALFAVAVTYLWNWLMPGLFGLPEIGYLQALGLLLLTRLMVGGWHRGHHHRDDDHVHNFFKKKVPARSHEMNEKMDDFTEFWERGGRDAYRKYVEEKTGEL